MKKALLTFFGFNIRKDIMKKFFTKKNAAFLIIIFFPLLVSYIAFAETTSTQTKEKIVVEIPDKILLAVPEGKKATKSPVFFLHSKHTTIDCTTCHHNAYEILAIKSCLVESCHFNTDVKKGTESFYAAFHSKSDKYNISCLDCHWSLKKEGKKGGPTSCKDCHLKENNK